jgi:hypothetical protein
MNLFTIIIIIFILVIIIYIYNSKSKSTENMTIGMIPNCNMLNDKSICNQTNGCYYTPIGCLYDWKNI